MTKKLAKEGPDGALSSLQELMGKLREQAAQGQIDGALLDQAGAILDVAVNSGSNVDPSNVHGQMEGMASGASEAETPSMPEGVSEAGTEAETAPEEEEEPTSSVPSFGKMDDDSLPTPEADEDEGEPTPDEDEMSDKSTVAKGGQPVEGRPPIKSFSAPNLIFDRVDEMRAKLPQFMKALYGGSVREAQRVAGDSTIAFDAMFNMAQSAILTEGGWTSENMQKLAGSAQVVPGQLAKGITASTVPGVYLIRLAKLMLPVYAGMVNRIPSQNPTGMLSNQATWKAQLGFGSLDEAAGFRTAEAGIGQVPPTSFLTFNAPFNDVSYNDSVTLKAIRSGQGYSDPLQISVIKSMAALLRLQERIILGSNYASIGAMGAITASGSSTGGAIAAGSYNVSVTALTYEGWLNVSKGVASSGSAVGESVVASTAAQVVVTGSTNSIAITWAAVKGAVAYNVYLSASGSTAANALYNKTVYTTKAILTAASTATTIPPTTDGTVNALGINGLISWAELSTVYGNVIPNKTSLVDLAGAGLTAANGGITQIDTVLASLATTWQTSPTSMVMSPNMANSLTGKILSLNSAATYRIDVSNERGSINGGMMVYGYVNKFFSVGDGLPKQIDVIPHPYMPDGTILMLSETIPYPMGNETRGFVRDVLLPYTYFPLASSNIQYNYALTTSEVLEGFLPPAQTALVGIDFSL